MIQSSLFRRNLMSRVGIAEDHRDPFGDHRDLSGDHCDPSGDHRDPSVDHRDPSGDHRDPSSDHRVVPQADFMTNTRGEAAMAPKKLNLSPPKEDKNT